MAPQFPIGVLSPQQRAQRARALSSAPRMRVGPAAPPAAEGEGSAFSLWVKRGPRPIEQAREQTT
jgi:hypothetical protein